MTRILLIVALFFTVASARAEEPKEHPGIGGPSTDVKYEGDIRKAYEHFMAAWNRHDPKAMAAMWMIDGDHMEPDGRHARGQAEVEKLFEAEQSSVFKESTLKLTIETVYFADADVALVDGTYDLTGVRDQEGKEVPARRGHLTSALVNDGGSWKVAMSRAMIPVPLAYREK